MIAFDNYDDDGACDDDCSRGNGRKMSGNHDKHAWSTLKCSATRAKVTKPRRGCNTNGLSHTTTWGVCVMNDTDDMVQCFRVVVWAT